MQIIPQSSFSATPWKNGGGITREVLRVPAGGGPFRWRISVAQVDASGPFSDFAGYRRFMVLLSGGGVRLHCDTQEPMELRAVGDLAEFDGASATHGELIAGPCTDLNFIVSTSVTGVRAWVETVRCSCTPEHPRGALLAFAVRGGFAVHTGAATRSLAAGDFALASAEERLTLTPAPALGAAPGLEAAPAPEPAPYDRAPAAGAHLVFLATLDDNSG
jgi:environmental stress-induced protein Ves